MHSSFIISLATLLAAAMVNPVHGHTTLFYAGANGKLGSRNVCLVPSTYGNSPVWDVTSEDMRCRSKTISTNSIKKCSVPAGDTLTVQWQHIKTASNNMKVMSSSHVGPCLVYMAPLNSNGNGNMWFKVYEEGWNTKTDQWCTNKVINNNGKLDITIPKDIPSGDYLVRTELIALHQAKSIGGAQFYANCVVITVSGGSGTLPKTRYAIPGIYSAKDKGILYDRSKDPTTYVIPGPPMYNVSSSAGASKSSSSSSSK